MSDKGAESAKPSKETRQVIAVINLALLPAYLLWSGFVLAKLWTWFIVPLGAPALSVPSAIGIGLVVGFVTGRPSNEVVHSEKLMVYEIFCPAVALAVGAIVREFL